MDLSEFWLGMLGAAGAAAIGWFSGVFGWVYAKLKAWWVRRCKRRENHEALPELVRQWKDEIDQDRGRYTGEFAALKEMGLQQSQGMAAQNAALADLKDAIATTLSMSMAQFETSPVATFVCDADGQNILVNRAMCKMFGVDRDDLLGRRWQRFIAAAELESYLTRFAEAQAGHYEFEKDTTLNLPDKGSPRVRVHTQPHPRDTAPATRWVGTMVPLKPATLAAVK